MQSLLAGRFQLRIHSENKEEQVYSLIVAKNGPKFHESRLDETAADERRLLGLKMRPYQLTGASVSLHYLAEELSRQLSRKVIDQTGLDGAYDFDLRWAPDIADGDSLPMDHRSSPLCRSKWG